MSSDLASLISKLDDIYTTIIEPLRKKGLVDDREFPHTHHVVIIHRSGEGSHIPCEDLWEAISTAADELNRDIEDLYASSGGEVLTMVESAFDSFDPYTHFAQCDFWDAEGEVEDLMSIAGIRIVECTDAECELTPDNCWES